MESIVSNDGEVLLINKPLTWTSFDVVRKLKPILNVKKIGHAGTLDPLATGLLVVCTGKKTKTISVIQDAEKEYTGTFYLGATTASFDLETERENQCDISHLTPELINEAVSKFIGEIQQIPPMHSAIKLNGERAYTLARRGETAELKSRTLTITEYEITRIALPEIDFRIVCSKGTYIRSLARDLGEMLQVGAHLTSLCRTRIGNYLLKNAKTIEEMQSERNTIVKQSN